MAAINATQNLMKSLLQQRNAILEAEVTRLRAELAKCRELLRRAYGYTTAAADLLPEEIKDALAAKGGE